MQFICNNRKIKQFSYHHLHVTKPRRVENIYILYIYKQLESLTMKKGIAGKFLKLGTEKKANSCIEPIN